MLEKFITQEVIFYAMGLLLVIGIVAKSVASFTVKRMVKASGEIQKSNHKLVKLMKAKFEHASMISNRVLNVGAFVDKYMYEYKVGGIRLHTWRTIPKKMLWIISALGAFAVFESYRIEGMGEQTLFYAQWTGLFILLLLLAGVVMDEKVHLEAARNYMVEYLENVCIHRYEKLNKAAEVSEEPEETVNEELVKANEEASKEMTEEEKRSEQEMRIRAILQEFLA